MRQPLSITLVSVGAAAALSLAACSSPLDESAQPSRTESTPSVYMQVRHNGGIAPVYSDMYLSHTVGGVGAGIPLIRNLTKTLSNGMLVMRVNVRGGTLANHEVWIDARNVEPRNAEAAAAYRAEAERLAAAARDAGAVASYWEAAANTARFLCISGIGASAALSVVTMGAETVGRNALIALIGFNTIRPLLDCAGIDYRSWGS